MAGVSGDEAVEYVRTNHPVGDYAGCDSGWHLVQQEIARDTRDDLKADIKDMRADLHREVARLDAKIDGVSLSLHARLDVIDADLRQFYHLSGKHEGRLDAIEKRLG